MYKTAIILKSVGKWDIKGTIKSTSCGKSLADIFKREYFVQNLEHLVCLFVPAERIFSFFSFLRPSNEQHIPRGAGLET